MRGYFVLSTVRSSLCVGLRTVLLPSTSVSSPNIGPSWSWPGSKSPLMAQYFKSWYTCRRHPSQLISRAMTILGCLWMHDFSWTIQLCGGCSYRAKAEVVRVAVKLHDVHGDVALVATLPRCVVAEQHLGQSKLVPEHGLVPREPHVLLVKAVASSLPRRAILSLDGCKRVGGC